MSENIDGGSTETTDTPVSGDVDAQLQEMQTSEQQEPEVKPEPEPEAKVKEEKVVPLAALHEERNARKELQRQLAEHKAQMDRVNQRLEVLFNPPKQPPNPQEDAVGYLDHRLSEIGSQQKAIIERDQQREVQAQQQAALHALALRVQSSVSEFAKQTPDYDSAVAHLDAIRIRELQLFGQSEAEARMVVEQEKNRAALEWAYQGRDPAKMAYELAKARGYQPKPGAQTPEQKIESQQKGTAAARSLGGGGAVSQGKLTASALADMSDEDFAKLSESQWRQAMGG